LNLDVNSPSPSFSGDARTWREFSALSGILKEEFARVEEQLKELGHELEAEFLAPIPASKVKPFRKKKAPGEKFCPICGTTVNHDGRAHKSQKKKKPFTAAELEALGR
jgi:hypothetical protein